MTTTAKKLTMLAVVAAAFALPAAAQAATITFTIPFEAGVPACNGDTIELSGRLLVTLSATLNTAGGITFASHTQPQGIVGTDVQTGTKYLGTGLTRDVVTVAPFGTRTTSFINRFHIQATSGAESFDVSETVHITQLPDGTVTAFVDNFSPACS